MIKEAHERKNYLSTVKHNVGSFMVKGCFANSAPGVVECIKDMLK